MEILYSFKFGYGYVFEIKQTLSKKLNWVLIIFDKITYMRHSEQFQRFPTIFNVKETNQLNECIMLKFSEMNDKKRWFEDNTYIDMEKKILLFDSKIYDLTKCSPNDNQFILSHIQCDPLTNVIEWVYDN